jgi:hypothetical protein
VGTPISTKGKKAAAPRSPTSKADASSATTARSGTANALISLPKTLIPWAVHIRRKAASRVCRGAGRSSDTFRAPWVNLTL